MDLFDDLSIRLEKDVPLGPLTWYGVGGAAGVVAHPSNVQQLGALVSRCFELGIKMYVLGSGANLLVSDEGVPVEKGIVVRLDAPFFRQVKEAEGAGVGGVGGGSEVVRMSVGAGFDLMKLVLMTAKLGYEGLQHVAGIPATVGGAVRMNAGGGFGEIGQSVARVQVMDHRGQVYYRDRDDLVMGYRETNIAAPYILSVDFEFTKSDRDALMKRVREIFMLKKNSQPMAENSAGCAFKNPKPPEYDADTPPAGKLIDTAGLKGYRVGGAEVSNLHANFLYTHPGCIASDVLAVMDHVRETVSAVHGVTLVREVVVW